MDRTSRLAVFAGASVGVVAATRYLLLRKRSATSSNNTKETKKQNTLEYANVIIGDVGGTNARLELKRLYFHDPANYPSKVLKKLTKYKSQDYPSFQACIVDFLKDVLPSNYPKIGVVGIAGAVNQNKVRPVNIPHWPVSDGDVIADFCNLDSFIFINDFLAAGYGVTTLQDHHVTFVANSMEDRQEGPNSVKLVVGPGTGLGHGILIKGDDPDGLYEPYPSEGGHVEFSVKTQEDWDLVEFARKYVSESNNVENRRGKRVVGRMSVETLCAGPAVPLIYSFMKEKYPDLEVVLEQDSEFGVAKKFDEIESTDIIKRAIERNDPLCMKVVEKFTEIFGRATGNAALTALPYGGIYLIGGVTNGISDYLIKTDRFMEAFYDKGRCSDLMRHFQVLLVNPNLEIGLRGAEEKARREMLKTLS
eukprot:scaffold3849_cov179-Amphora_coffeaeformis.AAC.31